MALKIVTRTWFTQTEPTTIYLDSQSAIALSEIPDITQEADMSTPNHFTKEKILTKEVQHMTTNILAKSLPKDKLIIWYVFDSSLSNTSTHSRLI